MYNEQSKLAKSRIGRTNNMIFDIVYTHKTMQCVKRATQNYTVHTISFNPYILSCSQPLALSNQIHVTKLSNLFLLPFSCKVFVLYHFIKPVQVTYSLFCGHGLHRTYSLIYLNVSSLLFDYIHANGELRKHKVSYLPYSISLYTTYLSYYKYLTVPMANEKVSYYTPLPCP